MAHLDLAYAISRCDGWRRERGSVDYSGAVGEVVDSTTLRLADGGSYGSTGELVHFHVRNGEVHSAVWAGTSMWPERSWPAAERRLLRRRSPATRR